MSFIELTGVQPSPETFSFAEHGLNCFTVPKYLATNAFCEGNRELFYAYLYFYTHYDINRALGMPRDARELHVLNSKLGLTIETISARERLVEQIIESLNNGWPVFLPINLADVFYRREYYRTEPHPHLLLIKGYNARTRIFVTMDCEQNTNLLRIRTPEPLVSMIGSVYSEFYLPWDMVEYLHESYGQNFTYLSYQVQIMKPADVPVERVDPYKDMASLLEPWLANPAQLIDAKFRWLEQHSEALNMVLINSQCVLVKTLGRLLGATGRDGALHADLETAGLAAWSEWKRYVTALALSRGRPSRDRDARQRLQSQVVAAESTFLKIIHELGRMPL